MGKKELSIQGRRYSFVLGELFAVVRRERMHALSKEIMVSETAWLSMGSV